MNNLYTIGYSTYDIDSFIYSLVSNNINALADVRSFPYSRYKPEFNKENLKIILSKNNIEYVFLGEELGARPKDTKIYVNGRVDFNIISKSDNFMKGIERINKGLEKYTIVLMCAELDPIKCHRDILICRNLKTCRKSVNHILENGKIENNNKTEERLLTEYFVEKSDLFLTNDELLETAYDKRSFEIAYQKLENENE